MDSLKKDLGKKLREIREQKGFTQAELAEKSNIHVNYYARVERGEVNSTVEVLQRIAKTLNIKSSEILPF